MRTIEELRSDAETAFEEDEWSDIEDIVLEALGHLSSFCRDEDQVWDSDDVKELCHDIGDGIYDKWGFREMQAVHNTVYCVMGGVAARTLEYFWNGCGDGAWRA